jgi:hypothetical protein
MILRLSHRDVKNTGIGVVDVHVLIVSYLQNENANIKNVMPSTIPTMPPAIGISSWPFLRSIRQPRNKKPNARLIKLEAVAILSNRR